MSVGTWVWQPWASPPRGRCDSPNHGAAGGSACAPRGTGRRGARRPPRCAAARGAPLPPARPMLLPRCAWAGLCPSCSQEAIPEPKAASRVSVASHGAFVLGFSQLSSECVFAERRCSPDETFHSDALCEKISCFGPA